MNKYKVSAYMKCQDVQHTIVGGGTGWLCRVQVNSEQVSFESFAEAGERLCGPDINRELVPPLWSQDREEL